MIKSATLNLIPLLLVLLSSCTQQTSTSGHTPSFHKFNKPTRTSPEREIYINSVSYFAETKEFYVTLQLKNPDGFNWDAVTKMTDSTIYQDDEMKRSRVPMSLARQHFNLDLLDTLEVFNTSHDRIAEVLLSRVEYYEPNIESYFIAVFNVAKSLKVEPGSFYCMSPITDSKPKVVSRYITDSLLTKRIKTELNIQPVYQWEVKHVQIKEAGSLYSVLSFQEPSGNTSYLTETTGNRLDLLYKQTDVYSFCDILPIPLPHYNKPVLLITMMVPDTDAQFEHIPFVFNGKKYVPFFNNRISGK